MDTRHCASKSIVLDEIAVGRIATHLLEKFLDDKALLGDRPKKNVWSASAYHELVSRLTVQGYENVRNAAYLTEYCDGLNYDRGHLDAFIKIIEAHQKNPAL